MKKLVGILTITLALLGYSAQAQKLPINPDVRTGKLSNGLTYYVMKNSHPENQAKLRLVVKVGSAYEDDDQNGLAHFTEHMAFNGTKHFPGNSVLDFLQKNGLKFGADINAGTGLDQTQYELPIVLKDDETTRQYFQILQDWAMNLSYDDDMIDSERGVIVSEWRQRNNAQLRLRNKHAQKQFANSIYAKRDGLGDTVTLLHFEHDVIRRFYRDWYRPDIMAVVAVGDFDVDKIEAMVKEYFSVLKNPTENYRKWDKLDIPFHKETIVSIASDKEMPVEMASVQVKLPLYDESTLQGFQEGLKRNLFDFMLNNRLSEIQRQPNPPFIQSGANEGRFLGNKRAYFMVAVCKTGSIKKGLEIALTEAARVLQHGFTQGEFERAKQTMLSNIENSYNSRQTRQTESYVDEMTRNFAADEAMPGIEMEQKLMKEYFGRLTLSEVNALAKQYLTKENCVISISLPEKETASKLNEKEIADLYVSTLAKKVEPYKDLAVDKPFFDKKVNPGKIVSEKNNDKLDMTEIKLDNGIRLLLKSTDYKKEEVLVEGYSVGGKSLVNDEDLPSAMVADNVIVEAGLGSFDVTSLQKILTGKNCYIAPNLDDTYEGFKGVSNKKDLEILFQMLNLYFTEPRKDQKAFNSFIERIRPNIANRSNVGDEVMNDTISQVLAQYNKRELLTTLDNLNKIDYDKAYRIYKERFSDPGSFTFIIVGDFDLPTVKEYAKKYLGSLPAKDNKESIKDHGQSYPTAKITKKIVKGNEDKSHVRLMITGKYDWNLENNYLLNSLIELLRIKTTEVIREEKGGSYSPGIWVDKTKFPEGEYCINIDYVLQPSRVDELVEATVNVMKKLQETEESVGTDKVRKAQERQREINMKNNNHWLQSLLNSVKYGFEPDVMLKDKERIQNLKAGDLKKAAKKFFNFDNLIQIVLEPEKV